MAYQSLNIIGSFTAGTAYVQNQVGNDRQRAEAYRQALKEQVKARTAGGAADEAAPVEDIDANDRMVIGDAPEGQRNPYLLRPYSRQKPIDANPSPQASDEPDAGSSERLDIVV